MLYKLRNLDFHKIRDLFIELEYNNQIFSILDGIITSEVFVDNLNYPKNAVIISQWRVFFGGFNVISDFIDAVKHYLEIEYPKIVKNKSDAKFFRFYWPSDEWKKVLESKFQDPISLTRKYYSIQKLAIPNWRELIPEGFTVVQIDESLLTKESLINIGWLTEEIEGVWDSYKDFLQTGGGFCVLKDEREIVCWSTFEYLTKDKKIECAVATKKEYQKKGLATLAVSASAEFALTNFRDVGWHCASDNLPSWKVSEKVGYKLVRDYNVFELYINQLDNKLYNGYIELTRKNFEKSINFYEQALHFIQEEREALKDSDLISANKISPASIHFRLGTLWAALGKNDNAFKHLNTAINLGFKDRKRFLTDEMLQELHLMQNWNILISRLPVEKEEE
ncbi:MAG: GNAT family N-acetyltransferase [Asgard group archaeon]|nr:GNAT family N-acetyltransferase [Asgard group archaeon]